MAETHRSEPVRYTAQIAGVREVALYGAADADYWRAALRPRRLWPHAPAGAARLMLSATALAWQGLAFRELIVTVPVCTAPDRPEPDGFYLAHACNSSRLLAWAERGLFQTPYAHRELSLDLATPMLAAYRRGQPLVRARMAGAIAGPATGAEAWSGPVFLPDQRPRGGRPYFMVAISGAHASAPFTPGADQLEIAPPAADPLARTLGECGFAPDEWRVRPAATHARSRTYLSEGRG